MVTLCGTVPAVICPQQKHGSAFASMKTVECEGYICIGKNSVKIFVCHMPVRSTLKGNNLLLVGEILFF